MISLCSEYKFTGFIAKRIGSSDYTNRFTVRNEIGKAPALRKELGLQGYFLLRKTLRITKCGRITGWDCPYPSLQRQE